MMMSDPVRLNDAINAPENWAPIQPPGSKAPAPAPGGAAPSAMPRNDADDTSRRVTPTSLVYGASIGVHQNRYQPMAAPRTGSR